MKDYATDTGAAMRLFESASNTAEIEDALDAFELASGPEEMARLIVFIDGQQAEIDRLKAENARLLSDVTRPESIDVGLMRAEIERLKTAIKRTHSANGRYHSQLAMCDLYDAVGLPNVRPTKETP